MIRPRRSKQGESPASETTARSAASRTVSDILTKRSLSDCLKYSHFDNFSGQSWRAFLADYIPTEPGPSGDHVAPCQRNGTPNLFDTRLRGRYKGCDLEEPAQIRSASE